MGIPLYFRYLVKNYPNIILNITKGTKFLDETSVERIRLKEINHLFLDMNCLIHPLVEVY